MVLMVRVFNSKIWIIKDIIRLFYKVVVVFDSFMYIVIEINSF